LLSLLNRPASELSHGQLQWLELAMVISRDPKVVLLDEPAAGMTAAETEKTAELLLDLAGDHTVLVIEHDMTFVRQICRTITVMHQGIILAEGCAQEIERNPEVIAAYLGSTGINND
jgi:urea transport system ATP-binding protein